MQLHILILVAFACCTTFVAAAQSENFTCKTQLVQVSTDWRPRAVARYETFQVIEGPHKGAFFTFVYRSHGGGFPDLITNRYVRKEQPPNQEISDRSGELLFQGNILDAKPEKELPVFIALPYDLKEVLWRNGGEPLRKHLVRTIKVQAIENNRWKVVAIEDEEEGEPDGADQPATALESKPEGKQKPQPESEGRSQ